MKIPKVVGFLIMMAILTGLGYLLPWTVVLGKAGLLEPNVAKQLDIYSKIFTGFMIGTIILYVTNLLWKKNDKYGDNIGLFNKDETKIGKRFTYGQITLLSIILFSSLFLISNSVGAFRQGIFGLQVLPQQFTPTDSLLVSTFQIPISENLMFAFTIGLIVLILTLIAMKLNWSKEDFNIYKYLTVISLSGIFGYIWHQTVYSSSSIASTTVAIFWALGGAISLITGCFIPFLIMHMTNNFFIDYSRLYSSDILYGTIIALIIGLGVLYYYLYKGRLLGKNE